MTTITRAALGYVTARGGFTAAVQATLTWDPADPLAVRLDTHPVGATTPQTTRHLSRHELTRALLGFPCQRDATQVRIDLDETVIRINHLGAEIALPRTTVEDVIEKSGDVVPVGAETLNVDGCITAILGGAS